MVYIYCFEYIRLGIAMSFNWLFLYFFMVYSITSGELRDYVYGRIVSPPLPGNFQSLLNAKSLGNSSFQLWTRAVHDINSLTCTFDYSPDVATDRVEVLLQPNKPGLDEGDVFRFLEQMVVGDRIFQEGFPLCPRMRNFGKNIREAQRTFLRIDDVPGASIACRVPRIRGGKEYVKELIYDYMFRPGLFYLFRMGEFSKP